MSFARFFSFSILFMALSPAGVLQAATASLKPKVTVPPVSQTVELGDTATFTVTVTGQAPFTYQWRLNGQPLVGQTGATLNVITTGIVNEGRYDVIVTNSLGSARSKPAVLAVNVAPASLPVGTVISGELTFKIWGETITEGGSYEVTGATTLIDPDDDTADYVFVYERLPKNKARVTIYGQYFDYDIYEWILVGEVHTLSFTGLNESGALLATTSVKGVLVPPEGYRPSKLNYTARGSLSLSPAP